MAQQRRTDHVPQGRTGSPGGKPKGKKPRRKGRALRTVGTLFLIFAITCSFLACFAALYIKTVIVPNADLNVADYPMNLSSTIYYTDPTTGETMEYQTLHGDENRVWVSYDEIPENLLNAAVAIEDRRFYEHNGVDWLRTLKSIITMFTGGRIQGGSTITQQLIKNLTAYDDVTVKRKVLEIFRALEFDKKYSKEQTLEWYLNYIYFGKRCYGVYTASYTYFGKDVSQLDLAECASLISITNNPSLYDPFNHPENNATRRGLVLDAMVRDGYISQEECDAAKAEEIDFHSAESGTSSGTLYSWYTEQVITDVVKDLIETYDYSETVAENLVYSGGLKIFACVDPSVQNAIDSIYSDASNLPYTSASGQKLQSAIVIIDDQGNVVGLAGKMGQKTSEDTRGFNLATRALRQPGSSIKPLAVYAPAIEMGLITPYSVFEDSAPMLLNDEPWPSNVNHRYTGQMTVQYAVANSTNTVAVRVLEEVTPEVGFEYLRDKFHIDEEHLVESKVINGKEYSDIGYSQMALGGLTTGVSPMDMASAYSVFQRNGIYSEPRTYSKVLSSDDKVLLENDSEGEAVLKEKTVYYVNELLKDVITDGGGSAAAISGMTTAGKTGSTNSNNDRWFVGYTPYYTAAVWVGYRNPERVSVSGSNPAAVLFKKVMTKVHTGLSNKSFPQPSGLVSVAYCKDTGLLATEACQSDLRGSRVATGYLLEEDVPVDYCEAHVMVEVCTDDPILKEDGQETGRYHLASDFCPEATETTGGKISVAVLDLEREYVGGVHPEDDGYLLSSLTEEGFCTVHDENYQGESEGYDPGKFDITDPSTWPTEEEDPFFDPSDPDTWPGWGEEEPADGDDDIDNGDEYEPEHTAAPAPSHTPVPTVTESPEPTPQPEPTPPQESEDDELVLPPGA